ncbi:MAG: polymer-forming cytoskeletal protein [Armatimonadetes bacterium]|nr:MAG: polymer-forming cytoskeletal protein [Armatimonadota bacterium]
MSSETRSRSSLPFYGLALIGLLGVLAPFVGSLVTTNIFVVAENDPIAEDVYVTSLRGVVDGVIDGDLTIFTGDLVINGEVTGSVQVFSSGSVTISDGARIGGSLRGAARSVTVSGQVGFDMFASAASVVIEESGMVARDVMAFGGVVRIEGDVGRDVRGRMIRTVIDGSVGGDIDVATQRFEAGPSAVVDGDVLYRSPTGASIDAGAEILGTTTRLPSQSNFVYGVILTIANLVGFLGFLLSGLVVLFVLRGSSSRATGAVVTKPIRSFLYGLVAVVVAPIAVVVLAATLVGLPLAIMLAMAMVASLVVGPVPAVAALGNRVLWKKGGILAAFTVGAVLWRAGIWLIPVVGGILYVIALVWGIGAWIVGFVETRRGDEIPLALLPERLVAEDRVPDNWVPPLSPSSGLRVDNRVENLEVDGVADVDGVE